LVCEAACWRRGVGGKRRREGVDSRVDGCGEAATRRDGARAESDWVVGSAEGDVAGVQFLSGEGQMLQCEALGRGCGSSEARGDLVWQRGGGKGTRGRVGCEVDGIDSAKGAVGDEFLVTEV
jgi:hypothetical protein